MLASARRSSRFRHRREGAFTLIEVIVSIAILGIVAAAIAGAFAGGLRALAHGGVQDRLTDSRDFSFFEAVLGKDGARATCITAQDPVTKVFTVYGETASTCATTTGYGKVAGCVAAPYAILCLAWPQLGTAAPGFLDSSCEVAVYTSAAPAAPATPPPVGSVSIIRTLYTVPLSGASSSSRTIVNRFDTVQFQVQSAAPASYVPSGETPAHSYNWLRSLPIKIVGTGVAQNQLSQTLTLHPVAVDPDGAAAAVTSDGSPC